jgi:hypothetical protein
MSQEIGYVKNLVLPVCVPSPSACRRIRHLAEEEQGYGRRRPTGRDVRIKKFNIVYNLYIFFYQEITFMITTNVISNPANCG